MEPNFLADIDAAAEALEKARRVEVGAQVALEEAQARHLAAKQEKLRAEGSFNLAVSNLQRSKMEAR